jgi:hypothetical protein
MISKIAYLNPQDPISIEIKEKLGDFNDLPPNFQEISIKEFVRSNFFIYSYKYHDFRQVTNKKAFDVEYAVNLRLFIFDDYSGFALRNDYWGKKLHIYKFAYCIHETEITKQNNCYREFVCRKCGYKSVIDSSD